MWLKQSYPRICGFTRRLTIGTLGCQVSEVTAIHNHVSIYFFSPSSHRRPAPQPPAKLVYRGLRRRLSPGRRVNLRPATELRKRTEVTVPQRGESEKGGSTMNSPEGRSQATYNLTQVTQERPFFRIPPFRIPPSGDREQKVSELMGSARIWSDRKICKQARAGNMEASEFACTCPGAWTP